jgi:hypothetical protein
MSEGEGQFVPLSVAAAIAYGSLIGAAEAAHDSDRLEAHLDYVASEIASILPLFAQIDGAAPQILPPERVVHGRFSDGGQVLHLPGEGEPVSGLRVRCADLEPAIQQLRARIPRSGAWPPA